MLFARLTGVVVRAAGSLAALQQAVEAGLVVDVVEEDALDVDAVAHDGLPPLEVVLVAGESVDEEAGPAGLGHRLGEERNGDLNGHDAAVENVLGDEVAVR